ncbi:hypothetical protein DBV15_07829 [Temnothorax longispinosus]|uniref:Uncharacterized protein n=1 Tax=Temnothorax longispinosus TaxID=300112 RepID=A0A4S2K652_9HYME|nr:hypothetical protein DBV15_07829 [Temnothorax longispinosus]
MNEECTGSREAGGRESGKRGERGLTSCQSCRDTGRKRRRDRGRCPNLHTRPVRVDRPVVPLARVERRIILTSISSVCERRRSEVYRFPPVKREGPTATRFTSARCGETTGTRLIDIAVGSKKKTPRVVLTVSPPTMHSEIHAAYNRLNVGTGFARDCRAAARGFSGAQSGNVGYPRGEDEGRKKKGATSEGKGGRRNRRRRRRRRRKRRSAGGDEAQRDPGRENGEREGRGEEDVCPLAMIIAESHRTWKDRKNDSPSAVFSFAIARRERERARM